MEEFSQHMERVNLKETLASFKKSCSPGKNFKMTIGDQIRDFIKVEKVACHFTNAILRNDIHIYKPLVVNVGSGKVLH